MTICVTTNETKAKKNLKSTHFLFPFWSQKPDDDDEDRECVFYVSCAIGGLGRPRGTRQHTGLARNRDQVRYHVGTSNQLSVTTQHGTPTPEYWLPTTGTGYRLPVHADTPPDRYRINDAVTVTQGMNVNTESADQMLRSRDHGIS